MSVAPAWHVRETCRLCDARGLETVLELKPTPPANEFLKPTDGTQEPIPLYLARCPQCEHVQLPVVVDPRRLFSNYVYVSGTSPAFVEHFREYAEQQATDLSRDDFVVEIGSNDGTLLRFFQEAGMRVLGVDPALEIAFKASGDGIPTMNAFFTPEIARDIRERRGHAKLVVANNVFAHADDLRGIALAVKDLLAPNGRFVFEVQYLVDLVEKNLFDMIYHEHLSYHSVEPLAYFFDQLGMSMVDVERVPTHGGSIRCTVMPHPYKESSQRMLDLIEHEKDRLCGPQPFENLRKKIDQAGADLRLFLAAHQSQTVAGYGAPAKLTTLTHEFGITGDQIAYVVDDSPWKQGLLTPGTRIPVMAAPDSPVDAFVIFAWNFAEPIAKKLRAAGFKGTIVAPLPHMTEYP